MESDVQETPAAEQWLSRFLPLPYRIATLIVLGFWLYANNLTHLSAHTIDTPSLLRHPPSPQAHRSVTRLATTLTLPLLACLLCHALYPTTLLPTLYLFAFVPGALALPAVGGLQLSRRGRARFLSTLRRVSVGGLAPENEGRFADVLVADVLTSYAKPVADLWVVGCAVLKGEGVLGAAVDRRCGGGWVVPGLIAVPFLIRFRQCAIEAMRAREHGKTGFQHMANALKYATAFPVLLISALKRESHPELMWASETGLSRLWLLAVFTNSLYSFYWDVTKDWDLTLFAPAQERNAPEQPWGLRRQRVFQPDVLYYAAIVVDLLLRCTWSLKLSVHLYHVNDLEAGIFFLELLEILRRWMWVFLRVETEWVRQRGAITLDSVPLVDTVGPHAKIDDD
ncbi:hypothetical protein Q7P37_002594 [Cladosporium fusiforme]